MSTRVKIRKLHCHVLATMMLLDKETIVKSCLRRYRPLCLHHYANSVTIFFANFALLAGAQYCNQLNIIVERIVLVDMLNQLCFNNSFYFNYDNLRGIQSARNCCQALLNVRSKSGTKTPDNLIFLKLVFMNRMFTVHIYS